MKAEGDQCERYGGKGPGSFGEWMIEEIARRINIIDIVHFSAKDLRPEVSTDGAIPEKSKRTSGASIHLLRRAGRLCLQRSEKKINESRHEVADHRSVVQGCSIKRIQV